MPPSRLANILAFHSLGIGLGSHYKGATPYGRLGKEFRTSQAKFGIYGTYTTISRSFDRELPNLRGYLEPRVF